MPVVEAVFSAAAHKQPSMAQALEAAMVVAVQYALSRGVSLQDSETLKAYQAEARSWLKSVAGTGTDTPEVLIAHLAVTFPKEGE